MYINNKVNTFNALPTTDGIIKFQSQLRKTSNEIHPITATKLTNSISKNCSPVKSRTTATLESAAIWIGRMDRDLSNKASLKKKKEQD